MREEVILDLRFRPRWAHRNASRACGILQLEHQHFLLWNLVAFHILNLVGLEVSNVGNPGAEHFLERIGGVRLNQTRDFCRAFCALENERPFFSVK